MRPEPTPATALLGPLCASLLIHALLWGMLVRTAPRQLPRESPAILVELTELPTPRPMTLPTRHVTFSPGHGQFVPRRRPSSPLPPTPPQESHPRRTAANTPRTRLVTGRRASSAPPPRSAAAPAVLSPPRPASGTPPPVTTQSEAPPAVEPRAVMTREPGASTTGETSAASSDEGPTGTHRAATPAQPHRPVADTDVLKHTDTGRIPASAGPGPTRGAHILRQSQPPYPPAARRDGAEGTVSLRVMLDERGAIRDIEIVSASGDARLDEAARQEVARWRFAPRLESGIGVPTALRVRVVFTLNDDP